jgi:hypothetical protein
MISSYVKRLLVCSCGVSLILFSVKSTMKQNSVSAEPEQGARKKIVPYEIEIG